MYVAGIRATLGLDIGPALLFVDGNAQLAAWGVSADTAFRRALNNVRERVRRRKQFALVHGQVRLDTPTVAFQSREGWASSLLLLPRELVRVLGHRDGILMAPMRDVLLLMPLDAEPGLALAVLDDFAEADIECSRPAPLRPAGRPAPSGRDHAGPGVQGRADTQLNPRPHGTMAP